MIRLTPVVSDNAAERSAAVEPVDLIVVYHVSRNLNIDGRSCCGGGFVGRTDSEAGFSTVARLLTSV